MSSEAVLVQSGLNSVFAPVSLVTSIYVTVTGSASRGWHTRLCLLLQPCQSVEDIEVVTLLNELVIFSVCFDSVHFQG